MDAMLLRNIFHCVRTSDDIYADAAQYCGVCVAFISLFAGAIFDESSEEAQIAFKYAVIRENMFDGKFELVPVIKTIQSTDSYAAEKEGKYQHL